MTRQRITDRTLKKTYAIEGDRLEIWDDLLPGFGMRITSRGVKSFFVNTRLHRQKIRVTLGVYPAIDLKAARDAARGVLQTINKGEDPRVIARAKADTVDRLVDAFAERHLTKLRPSSAASSAHYLRGRFIDRFAGRAPTDIKRAEIRALIDDIADEGHGITANRTLAAVRKMFGWAVDRGELDISPCHGLKAPAKEVQRTRFLTMEEVTTVWNAAQVLSPVYAGYVRVFLLTGQRRESVAQMRRCQIAKGIWTIPRENMKGDRTHSVPLSSLATRTIEQLPRFGDGDLVFTHDGIRPVAGFGKMKRQIDARVAVLSAESEMPEWRLHDLRRTAGTHIARLGFPRLLVSKILGHAEGGVTQIYELYSYDAEKRQALDAWSNEISNALDQKADRRALSRRSEQSHMPSSNQTLELISKPSVAPIGFDVLRSSALRWRQLP